MLGNLLISVICGTAYALILWALGVPVPRRAGLLRRRARARPARGRDDRGLIVVLAAFATSTTAGLIMIGFVVLHPLVENDILQPQVDGRTVALPPLAVLIAILIGSQVAGIPGRS